MQRFNTNTPRKNPRILITVHHDQTATVKGCYIDAVDHVHSLTRTYVTEEEAKEGLYLMRYNGAEFSIQVSRKV